MLHLATDISKIQGSGGSFIGRENYQFLVNDQL